MGEPIPAVIDLDVEVNDEQAPERLPGTGWTMAQQTVDAIRDVDASIRSAEQLSGSIIFG